MLIIFSHQQNTNYRHKDKPLEWLKWHDWQHPVLLRVWSKCVLTLHWDCKTVWPFWKSIWQFLRKLRHTCYKTQQSHTSRFLNRNDLYTNVFTTFTHDSRKPETTWVSTSFHIMGNYWATKKTSHRASSNLDASQNHHAEQKSDKSTSCMMRPFT